ncbi:MAG: hypothetical protein Kow0077_25100 [Anaerolineae bacterium]
MPNQLPSPISAILFDLDGTLRLSVPDAVDAVIIYLSELGITLDLEARRRAHRFAHEYWADRLRVEADLERLPPDEFWANYIRSQVQAMHVGVSLPDNVYQAVSHRFASEYRPTDHLADCAPGLLAYLRERRVTLGLVSNRLHPLEETVQALGLAGYFDFTLAAGEIGIWKPDGGIFTHALALAGNPPPANTLYVGDNYFVDVLGASKAGLFPVLVDPLEVFPEAHETALVLRQLSDLQKYLEQT